ncbi:MAG: hypothetical protein PHO91_02695 [Patescibacteria group bacterium]|nr:hypothetical protein [Patescibacteria group bacterium]
MQIDRRKKIIIIAIAILVILGVLFLIWRLSDRSQPMAPVEEEQPIFEAPSVPFEFDPSLPPAQTNTEFAVSELAKNFAERFGSWSSDNPGANLRELLPLSSSVMVNYLNNLEINYQSEEFFGISTKSLSSSIASLGPSQARVLVKTQRIKKQGAQPEEVFYQDIEISLVNSGDSWLVSAANWK